MIATPYSRRKFLLQLMYCGAGAYLSSRAGIPGFSNIAGANDRVRVGIIGLGAKGMNHLDHFTQIPNVEVCAICDLDEANLQRATAMLERAGLPVPLTTKEYRQLADLGNLDAVSIAVPKPKRVGVAMDLCRSGKDLIIERPFSLSAREGKQLVKAAEESGRVIQQKDDTFPFSLSDEISSIAVGTLGGIENVKSWLLVSHTPEGHAGAVKTSGLKDSQCALADAGWQELDMARCVLGGDVPTKIVTMGIGSASRSNQRIMVDVEYGSLSPSTRIQLEVAAMSNVGTPTTGRPQMTSLNHFYGPKGRLVISNHSDQQQLAERVSFRNFVNCVRERKPDQLLNHIGEARKSNLLVDLAKYSIVENKSFTIDPVTEAVAVVGA